MYKICIKSYMDIKQGLVQKHGLKKLLFNNDKSKKYFSK